MNDKFSYFDFICYFIPGTLAVWSVASAARGLAITEIFSTSNNVTDTIAFIIVSFVAGHLIQAQSKLGLEKNLKRRYWQGHFPSEVFLVRGNVLCPEADRARFVLWARKWMGFAPEELAELESDSEISRSLSHSIYRKAYSYVCNNKIEDRAATANTYYNFFRGLSSASFFSSLVFALYSAILIWNSQTSGKWAPSKSTVIFSLVLIAFFQYAFHVFRDRARQRGELHVYQVFNSAYAFKSGDSPDGKQS